MFKKILLTLDGSELARRALPYARDLARDGGAAVCILEVIDSQESIVNQLAGRTADLTTDERRRFEQLARELHAAQRADASRNIEVARREFEEAGVANVTTLIREGRPADEIVATAARLECDAIAMGARGHSGTQRESIGSVAESVVLNVTGAAVIIVGPRLAGSHGPPVFGARTISPPPEPPERER